MAKLEYKVEQKLNLANPDGLEDITELVFKAADECESGELISYADFDLNDTMSGFELMDPKMDFRVNYKSAMTPKKALDGGII